MRRGKPLVSFLRVAAVLWLCCLIVAMGVAAQADIRTYVTLHVNTIDQGEAVAILRDKDVLVPVTVLEAAGVRGLTGKRETIRDQQYVSLTSLNPDVAYQFNLGALSLDITVLPTHLGSTSLNLTNNKPANIEYPGGSSAYINYAFTDATGGFASAFFDGGFARGEDSLHYSFTTQRGESFRRGIVYFQMDDRDTSVRRVVGDLNANSGDLGGSMYLAGFGISRAFDLDPYAVLFPLPSLSGVATTPSVASIYVNGVLVQRVNLPPGSFNLGNLPVATGSANTQVVLTDAFGRTQSYSQNYFTAANLLKKGLTDYQFSVGFLRPNAFGINDTYGPAAAVGRYRIGVSNAVTIGGRFEVTPNLTSLGPTVDFKLPVGYFHLAASGSRENGLGGAAASIGYSFSTSRYGFSLSALAQGPYYSTISQSPMLDRPTVAYSATGSMQIGRATTLSAQFSRRHMRDSGTTDQFAISQTVAIRRGLALTFTEERDSSTMSAPFSGVTGTLNFAVGRADASITGQGGATRDSNVQIQESPAGRYGIGYLASYDPSYNHALNASMQYRSNYGDAALDYAVSDGASASNTLRVSGGVAIVDGHAYATRPVLGSYALVDVPGLAGVDVYHENELVGKTDRHGKLLVPDLLPNYGNDIRIDDKDAPMNTSIQTVQRLVAPAAQAGAHVVFAATELHALNGNIVVNLNGKQVVPVYGDLTLESGTSVIAESILGKGGEFYLEGVPAGKYVAHVVFREGECRFDFLAPTTDATLFKLGTLGCSL